MKKWSLIFAALSLLIILASCQPPGSATTGTLAIALSWPFDGSVILPQVTGTLTQVGGGPATISPTVGEMNATYSGRYEAGSYTLVLELRGSGVTKWRSTVLNIEIIAGGTTNVGPISLLPADIPPDFVEDFNDGVANGWNATDRFTVIGNAYAMTASGGSRWVASYFTPKTVSGDFTYQLTTGHDGGGDSRGMFFNATAGPTTITNGYAFCVSYSSLESIFYFWVRTYTNGIEVWSTGMQPTASTGTSCVMKAVVSGGNIQFYIDDILVYVLAGPLLYTSGYIGVQAIDMTRTFTFDDISLVTSHP